MGGPAYLARAVCFNRKRFMKLITGVRAANIYSSSLTSK
jgi:hypothetical protein